MDSSFGRAGVLAVGSFFLEGSVLFVDFELGGVLGPGEFPGAVDGFLLRVEPTVPSHGPLPAS